MVAEHTKERKCGVISPGPFTDVAILQGIALQSGYEPLYRGLDKVLGALKVNFGDKFEEVVAEDPLARDTMRIVIEGIDLAATEIAKREADGQPDYGVANQKDLADLHDGINEIVSYQFTLHYVNDPQSALALIRCAGTSI